VPFDDRAGTGAVWFLSRYGRYGRAVTLHHQLRERGMAGRPLDAATLRQGTVRSAMRWAWLTGRLAGNRPRREAVVGAVAAPLALPAVVLVGGIAAVLLLVDVSLAALLAVGGSVRTATRRPGDGVAPPAPPAFGWTPVLTAGGGRDRGDGPDGGDGRTSRRSAA
jgi:hypothetical protein